MDALLANSRERETSPSLSRLSFIPGCNTPPEVTRENLEANVKRDLPWLETEPLKDKPLVIVAGGPSLQYRWPEIVSHDGDILALNNAYAFLLDHEIIPNYWMLLDAREENIEFLRRTHPDVKHFVAGQCHPRIFDRLKGFKTSLYLTILPETDEVVKDIDKPKVKLAGYIGTVGMKALSLAYALGYRELHLYGYDSSYEDGAHHAFEQVLNDQAKVIDVYLDGKKYLTTAAMAHQASEFCNLAGAMVRAYGFDIQLHCNGLLPHMVEHSNRRGEIPLEQREREKYEAIWEHNAYRKEAPGEHLVEVAISSLGLQPEETVIDFGCGTGRASAALAKYGVHVLSIDHAANCLDEGMNLNFLRACLWELPEMSAKWGYCTDVMEHIPTEKVGDVLRAIAERCQKGAFFNIATRDDAMGGKIGQKLHMTVISAADWQAALSHFWKKVVPLSVSEDEATFACFHPQ